MLNFLPNGNIFFNMTTLIAFADDKLSVAKITISFFDRVEHCEKRRKCWFPVFSPFPSVFYKAFSFRVVKGRDCAAQS